MRGAGRVLVHADEMDPFALPVDAAVPGERVVAGPDLGTEVEVDQPRLLRELAADRLLRGLSRVDAASRRRPPRLAGRVDELHEQRPVASVEDESARGRRARPARASRAARRTSGAARRRERPRWPERSTGGRRARRRRAFESAGRAPAARRRCRGRPPCRRTRSPAGEAPPRSARGAPPRPRSRHGAGRPTLSWCDTRRSSRRSRAAGARTARAARTGAA